jgi:hypothetical protein
MPAFALPIVLGDFCLTYFFVFLIVTFVFYLYKFKVLNYYINNLLKNNSCKLLLLYFLLELIVTFIYILVGKSGAYNLLSVFMRFLLIVLPFVLGYFVAQNLNKQAILKLIYSIVVFIVLFGIFDFITFYFDIDILKSIFNFIVSRRLITHNLTELKTFSGGYPRIQSVFEEPCHLACFISAMLPFIYKFSFNKYQIYKNKYFNKFIKISMPLFAWIDIIGTQSPIFLMIALVVSGIYLLLINKDKLRKNCNIYFIIFAVLLIISFILFLIVGSNSFSDSYLLRIQTTLTTMKDINILIMAEQSLGRRLIDIINLFILFLKNPVLGCGLGNLARNLTIQLQHSPVVYTPEVINRFAESKFYQATPNIFFMTLAETGLVGTVVLYSFFISVYKSISKLLNLVSGSYYDLVFGLKHFVLLYIILSFYDSQLYFPYGLVLMGVCIGIFHRVKRRVLI